MLDYYQGGYRIQDSETRMILENGLYAANLQFPGMVIRYTLDGKDPDLQSSIYKDPIKDDGKGIKFRAFDTKGRGGSIAETE